MGIQGLHKGLSFVTQKSTLRDFRGKILAIDSSSWLHRSVYSVSQRYVEGIERNEIDPVCVRASAKYVISRVHDLLRCFEIAKVYLVMDGKRCPLKADTNLERELNRQANLKEARAYQRQGRRDKAEEKYKMCIKIKDELTIAVMKEVRQEFRNDQRLHLVWSPYEADAQLAKLCLDGTADAVITEVRTKKELLE
jgi:exonuclease 1